MLTLLVLVCMLMFQFACPHTVADLLSPDLKFFKKCLLAASFSFAAQRRSRAQNCRYLMFSSSLNTNKLERVSDLLRLKEKMMVYLNLTKFNLTHQMCV